MDTEISRGWDSNVLDVHGIERLQSLLKMIETMPELALVAALTLPEVGHLLRMNPRTVRRYIANGDLTAHNMGGKKTLRVKLVDLHEFWQRSPRVTDAR
jgi:excisionase family DNA binding protein